VPYTSQAWTLPRTWTRCEVTLLCSAGITAVPYDVMSVEPTGEMHRQWRAVLCT
jgi:hypothetical protein